MTDLATNQLVGLVDISEDKVRQFLIISTNVQLVAGRQYRLSMTFTSILNNELRGFYRSSYTENGTTKYMAVSQMQPTDARRAFPCFDEPNMKANFTMKLGRQTTQLSTSNMPVKETTAMSVSYIFLAYVFLGKYRIHMSVNQTLQSWKAGLRLGSLRDVTTCVNLSGWNDGFRDDVHRFASRFKRDAFPDLGEAGSHQSS